MRRTSVLSEIINKAIEKENLVDNFHGKIKST